MKQRFLRVWLVRYFGNVSLFVVTRQSFTNYRSGRYTCHQILKVVIFFTLLQEISRKWTVATGKPNLYQHRVGMFIPQRVSFIDWHQVHFGYVFDY